MYTTRISSAVARATGTLPEERHIPERGYHPQVSSEEPGKHSRDDGYISHRETDFLQR